MANKDGRMVCPVCHGNGQITEDANEYLFVTREPETNKCLVCNGEGRVGPRKLLPDGRGVYELLPGKNQAALYAKEPETFAEPFRLAPDIPKAPNPHRLNVSKKTAINPEVVDTGVGNQSQFVESPKEAYEKPMFLEMALNPRLNKVLASGKEFLIVTETEPYYLDVYRMIREQERKQKTWTWQDEEAYVAALEIRIKELDSRLRGNDSLEGGNDRLQSGNGSAQRINKTYKEANHG